MIYKTDNGVEVLEFGTGDICVVCIGNKVDSELYGVGYIQTDSVPIGTMRPEYEGAFEEDADISVKMTFTDVKSIDVVMEHLKKVKESMLKEQS